MGWFARARPSPAVSGLAGEDAALAYLESHGLTLVERNFRCKGGEIDLILREPGRGASTLVFVEVRKRASAAYGGAAASVTSAKQRRLLLAARLYLQRHAPLPPCRFDVVAIEGDTVNWIKDAIQA